MAKRFIDTELFRQGWFRKLPPALKSAWIYLITNCDHAGVYEPDLELMSFCVGTKITKEDIIKHLGDQISELNGGGKWFLHKFIGYQYGELREVNNAHKGVLKVLSKYNIELGACKGLSRPSVASQDKDKDKDKDKSKDKDIKSMKSINKEYLSELQEKHRDIDVTGEFEKFKDYCASKGKRYKDHRAGFRNWLKSDFVPKTNVYKENKQAKLRRKEVEERKSLPNVEAPNEFKEFVKSFGKRTRKTKTTSDLPS